MNLVKIFALVIYSILDIALMWIFVTERYRGSFLIGVIMLILITINIAILGRQLLDAWRSWYHGE